jgi:hypothetical protein
MRLFKPSVLGKALFLVFGVLPLNLPPERRAAGLRQVQGFVLGLLVLPYAAPVGYL